MRDPQQRDRQRRIAPPEASTSSAEARSQVYAPNSIWKLGIIRDVGHFTGTTFVSGTGDVLRWQRMRYERGQTPTFGEYEVYGPSDVVGYPLEGKRGADFTALKVVGAITSAAVPIRATRRGRFWIIETMSGGGGGSVFPVTLIKTFGVDGLDASQATWEYQVKDAMTGALLIQRANPIVNEHKWVRPNVGSMSPANFGLAYRNTQGNDALLWINEQVVQERCTE